MATIDYKEKYNKLVKAVKVLQETNPSDEGIQNWVNDNVPELKESEDERIRKELISFVYRHIECHDKPDAERDEKYESWIAWLEKQGEQKLAWSEEDEMFVHGLIRGLTAKRDIHGHTTFSSDCIDITETINWLKSLKDRVQPQPKREWSEEDINMIDWLIRCCEKEHEELCNDKYGHQDIVSELKSDCRKKWDWLESLKNRVAPQNTWKPSEEQMKALTFACIKNAGVDKSSIKALYDLKEQLKKLRK